MQKGIRPGTEMRCELLKTWLEMHTPWNIRKQIAASMRDKPDPEKERIAEQAVKDLRAGKL